MHKFSAKVKVYPGVAAWYFITLPNSIARQIDFEHSHHTAGFGSLLMGVTIATLTHGNPTMKAKFEELQDKKSNQL